MKALLAYFQGNFNNCSFEQIGDREFVVKLVDEVNQLAGSFIATYNKDHEIDDFRDDSGMKSMKITRLPRPRNE